MEGWVIGGPLPGCRCWLSLLGGIVRVVFELRPRWTSNVEKNSQRLSVPEHEGEGQGAKVREMREIVVNDNNCFSGVPSMCT
jgi:hypothetical protein